MGFCLLPILDINSEEHTSEAPVPFIETDALSNQGRSIESSRTRKRSLRSHGSGTQESLLRSRYFTNYDEAMEMFSTSVWATTGKIEGADTPPPKVSSSLSRLNPGKVADDPFNLKSKGTDGGKKSTATYTGASNGNKGSECDIYGKCTKVKPKYPRTSGGPPRTLPKQPVWPKMPVFALPPLKLPATLPKASGSPYTPYLPYIPYTSEVKVPAGTNL